MYLKMTERKKMNTPGRLNKKLNFLLVHCFHPLKVRTVFCDPTLHPNIKKMSSVKKQKVRYKQKSSPAENKKEAAASLRERTI